MKTKMMRTIDLRNNMSTSDIAAAIESAPSNSTFWVEFKGTKKQALRFMKRQIIKQKIKHFLNNLFR